MKFKNKVLLTIVPSVFVLDQLTKLAILKLVELGDRIPVIPGFFDIVHFRNTGAAFGMFSDAHHSFRVPFFYAVAVVAIVAIAFFYRSLPEREKLMPVAFSLVLAGIAGNVLDRIFLGSVVDFLSFHLGDAALDFTLFGARKHIPLEWPAFNVADSAITVAMGLLIWSIVREGRRKGGA